MRIKEDVIAGLEGVLEPGEQTAFGFQPDHNTIPLNDPLQILNKVDEAQREVALGIEAARGTPDELAIVQQAMIKALALKDVLRGLDNPAIDLYSWVPGTYQDSDWDY
ncbi:MAG: hypothetical protein JWP13_202 [Candidatus Saccharibacteria bacterium]|nr:hypothetical protein [Candidatus Saccharibacteria bacterium]